jgi:hypothetical protein
MFSVRRNPNEFYEYKTMSGVLPNRNIAALRLNSSVVKWYEKAGGVRKDKLPVAGGNRYVGLVMLFSTETGRAVSDFPRRLRAETAGRRRERDRGALPGAEELHHDGFARFGLAGERASGDDGDDSRFEASERFLVRHRSHGASSLKSGAVKYRLS